MALINCPECGKAVSDKALACPNCGYSVSSRQPQGLKDEKNGQTTLILVIILIGALIIGVATYTGYKLSQREALTEPTSKQADEAEEEKEIESTQVSLTKSNISDYINIDISFADLDDDTVSYQGTIIGSASATLKINCYALQDVKFEDAQITIDFDFDELSDGYGWEVPRTTINLSPTGSGSKTVKVQYSSLIYKPKLPTSESNYKISNVRGKVYINE